MRDQSLKRELEQVGAAYADCVARKDAAGIAALFVKGGVHVNEAGPRQDIEQFYLATFESGSPRMSATVDEVWSLTPDIATAIGEVRITGTDPGGATFERLRRSAATYVRDGGRWKIQMITTLPKA